MKTLTRFLLQGLLCVLLGTVAQAAVTVVNHDTWTCASSTTCNHTLTFTPTAGNVLAFTAMTLGSVPTNSAAWTPVTTQCGGTQAFADTIATVADVNGLDVVQLTLSRVVASPSTTCNVNSSPADLATGSIHIFELAGLRVNNLPTSATLGLNGTAAWGSNLSSNATATITPGTSGAYLFCIFGATASTTSPTFTGGSLTWTSYLEDTALGSNDVGFVGPYNSTSAIGCTYNYTGTFSTGGFIMGFLGAAVAPNALPPRQWLGAMR